MNRDESRLFALEAECLGMVESALILVRQAHAKWRVGTFRSTSGKMQSSSITEGLLYQSIGLLHDAENRITDEVAEAAKW